MSVCEDTQLAVAATSQDAVGLADHAKAYSECNDDPRDMPSKMSVLIGRSHGELTHFHSKSVQIK